LILAYARLHAIGVAIATMALLLMVPIPVHPAANSTGTPTANDVVKESKSGPAPDIEILPQGSAVGLLGRTVVGSSGENMGLVVDVIVDSDGKPRAAVIDFGGFLGVGTRKIAVDWSLLHFALTKLDAPLLLDLSRSEVQSAPKYKGTAGPLEILISPPDTKSASPSNDR
jgi:hypothetical protein